MFCIWHKFASKEQFTYKLIKNKSRSGILSEMRVIRSKRIFYYRARHSCAHVEKKLLYTESVVLCGLFSTKCYVEKYTDRQGLCRQNTLPSCATT
eukprot:jgi/Antlo1/1754/2187